MRTAVTGVHTEKNSKERSAVIPVQVSVDTETEA
jgi:hypothetical protein